jgi:hypothetical protein
VGDQEASDVEVDRRWPRDASGQVHVNYDRFDARDRGEARGTADILRPLDAEDTPFRAIV